MRVPHSSLMIVLLLSITSCSFTTNRDEAYSHLDNPEFRTAFKKTIHDNQAAIGKCYEDVLALNPRAKGVIKFQWLLGKGGRLESGAVVKNETGDQGLADCVLESAKSWKFPPPPGDAPTAEVTYPINFTDK